MHTPQTIIRLEARWATSQSAVQATGWAGFSRIIAGLFEHGGSVDGMRALVAILPEEKMGVVILTNLEAGTVLFRAVVACAF